MRTIVIVIFFFLLGSLRAAETLIVEKLEGPVTSAEVTAFKNFMRGVAVPVDNLGNAMVYGVGGTSVESLGRIFEISGDRELLDLMLRFTDEMLAARNDSESGLVIWTGERDAVWPNSVPKEGKPAYAGTETGDVVGHIAYVSGRYGITAAMMEPFANTVLHVMALPGPAFTGRTDGENPGKRPPGTLHGHWIDLCEFAPELLPLLHEANRGRIKSSADTTANLLWQRHRLDLAAR